MGSYANTSHNLKQIDSAFRWGIMQNSPVDDATFVFDLVGGYPAGRKKPDGDPGDTSFPAGSGRMGSIGLKTENELYISFLYLPSPIRNYPNFSNIRKRKTVQETVFPFAASERKTKCD